MAGGTRGYCALALLKVKAVAVKTARAKKYLRLFIIIRYQNLGFILLFLCRISRSAFFCFLRIGISLKHGMPVTAAIGKVCLYFGFGYFKYYRYLVYIFVIDSLL